MAAVALLTNQQSGTIKALFGVGRDRRGHDRQRRPDPDGCDVRRRLRHLSHRRRIDHQPAERGDPDQYHRCRREWLSGIGQPLTVVNDGRIQTGGKSLSSGISLAAGGMITNQNKGEIEGLYGVKASGGATTVVTYGDIKAQGAPNYAVLLGAGIRQSGGAASRVQFRRHRSGGNTIGAPTVSNLELAANTTASSANLTGLGTRYIDFRPSRGCRRPLDSDQFKIGPLRRHADGQWNADQYRLAHDRSRCCRRQHRRRRRQRHGRAARRPAVQVTSTGIFSNTGAVDGGAGGAGGAGVAGSSLDSDRAVRVGLAAPAHQAFRSRREARQP